MGKNIVKIGIFFLALAFVAPSHAAGGIFKKRKKDTPKDTVVSDYRKITGRDSAQVKGVAGVFKKDGSFYLEFPAALAGREFLVTNRLQKVPLWQLISPLIRIWCRMILAVLSKLQEFVLERLPSLRVEQKRT